MDNTRIFCIVLCVCMVLCLIACTSEKEGENCRDDVPFVDKVWGTPKLIKTDSDWAEKPQVGFDGSGNAVAVWQQWDGAVYNIRASRYVVCTGWDTSQLIETDSRWAGDPQVAVDGSGNAVVVWYQYDEGTRWNIWANRYVAGTGWSTAQLIETNDKGSAENPQVGVDGNGNAVAVWWQSDGTRKNIWANRYVADEGWGTAQPIETNMGNALNPQVVVDGSGNAFAVWYQDDGTRYSIWANRYVADEGWGTAHLIEEDNRGDASGHQVGVDGSGNAIAVWNQSDGTRHGIWASRYVADAEWDTAQPIDTDNSNDAYEPQIGIDGSGNAVAVWNQSDGTRYNVWANHYVAGTGWGTAHLIETENSGDTYDARVGIDGSGNAVAVWRQYDGTRYNVWANHYVAGTGWGTAQLIETDTGNAWYPQVAVDGSGNAVAVWHQDDGTRNDIWFNTRR